jgi:hypothetical protein
MSESGKWIGHTVPVASAARYCVAGCEIDEEAMTHAGTEIGSLAARFLKATLRTLARQDWRDSEVVRRVAMLSIEKFPAIALGPEAAPEAAKAASTAYVDLLLATLERLNEPGFDLPAFLDRDFDAWIARESGAPAQNAFEAISPVDRRDRGPPTAQLFASRTRSGLRVAGVLGATAAAIAFAWATGLSTIFFPHSAPVDRLPPPEVRLAFATESNEARTAEQIAGDFAPVLAENRMNPPGLTLSPDGLFAHAPSRVSLTLHGEKRLFLAFGIRRGAWEGDSPTDGACFRVMGEIPMPLFERCIDPRQIEAERRVQVAFVSIPPATTKVWLETSCRGHCASDWTYWKIIRPNDP